MSREKQIEEMAKLACTCFDGNCKGCPFDFYPPCPTKASATRLYNAGYRKQKEGEWIEQIKTTTNAKGMTAHYTINFCSNCSYEIGTIRYRHKYCPNCGAKMKGTNDERAD